MGGVGGGGEYVLVRCYQTDYRYVDLGMVVCGVGVVCGVELSC